MPGLLSEVGIRIIAVLPFVAIPILVAVLSRSMSLAFLLTVLFFVADLALTGSAQFWQASPVPWVPAVTVTGSISRLLLGSEDQFLASLAPQSVSLVALLGWSTLPVVAAIARFRRIDINE